MPESLSRCYWASNASREDQEYHDKEWGVPCTDDQVLFEFLILEGAQAGLSWSTILKKREGYRQAFDNFDPQRIALYTDKKKERLRQNPQIIRNRLKIEAAVTNAQAMLNLLENEDSLAHYLWSFVDGQPVQNHWKDISEVPATTVISDKLSRDLKQRGFKFVGPTICYAFMQATGMVNDHTTDCFRHKQVIDQARNFKSP
jgi:DNA-3-methyladenine glycosylase I